MVKVRLFPFLRGGRYITMWKHILRKYPTDHRIVQTEPMSQVLVSSSMGRITRIRFNTRMSSW